MEELTVEKLNGLVREHQRFVEQDEELIKLSKDRMLKTEAAERIRLRNDEIRLYQKRIKALKQSS